LEQFDLMNAEYVTKAGRAVICLSSRDARRQQKVHSIKGYTPHFWAVNSTGKLRDHFGRPIVEVDTVHPTDVREERKKFEQTLEADIKFPWRYLFDKGVKCGYGIEDGDIIPTEDLDVPPNKGLFDIEVESPPEIMAKPREPIYPIVSFQFSTNYSKNITLFMLKTQLPEWQKVDIPDYFTGCRRAITLPVDFEHRGLTETVHPIIYLYDKEKPMIWDATQWFDKQHFDASGGYASDIFDFPYWMRRGQLFKLPMVRLSPYRRATCKPQQVPKHLKWLYRERTGRFDVYIKGLQTVDLMTMYKKWAGGRQPIVKGRPFGVTYDFHRIMEYECDFHYVDLGDRVAESRQQHPIDWLEYCVGDAYALRILEEEKKIIRFFDRLRRIVGCPLSWATKNSRLIDTRLLRLRDHPLPTRKPTKTKRVKGAIVFLPDIGIHENIAYIDEKSLYPMIIVVYNLGSDTLVRNKADWRSDDIVVGPMEDGTILHFRSKPQSLLAKCVQHDMEEREKYRQQLVGLARTNPQYELLKMYETLHKFLACSYYGVTGYEGFRLANDLVRKAITFLGRKHLMECKVDLEREGYRTRYGDTDSLFVQLLSKLMEEGRVVEAIVNRTLNRIARKFGATYYLEAKYEHYCKSIIFVPKIEKKKGEIVAAKKRYAYTDEKDQLYVVGMAPRSSATAEVTRSTMLEWLELILIHKDIIGAKKLVRRLWNELPNYELHKVAIPRGVHREGEYKHRDPWDDGCEFMRRHFGFVFREDKRPMLIYMKKATWESKSMKLKQTRDLTKLKAVCITEATDLPEELKLMIDWQKMRKKVVEKKFITLFQAIGIDWKEVMTGERQAGMEQWQ